MNLPWSVEALRGVGIANLLGLTGTIVAGFGAFLNSDWERQQLWLLLGILSLMVLVVADASWFLVGRRAVGTRRREVLGPLAERLLGGAAQQGMDGAQVLVAVPGMRHYHRSSCQTVIGKAVAEVPLEEHQRAGRGPCGMCTP